MKSDKKKILVIENSVGYTGAFKAALQQAQLLRDEYQFVFLIPEKSNQQALITEMGFKLITMPLREISRSPLNILLYLPSLVINTFRLKRILRKEKIDVVQVNDFYNQLGTMVKLFGYKGKLITYVRLLPSAMPRLLSRAWIKLAQRYSYKVITVSNIVFGQLPAKANTIRLYDPISLDEKLSSLTGDTTKVCFLYLANFTRGKGQEYAVQAFANAYQQQKNIRLYFYGGDMGLEKNRQFRRELEEQVNILGLTDIISFHGFSGDIETNIKATDVVLNFSEAESFSMTCAEAGFYGKPVIATRCGGPEEIIADQLSGLLVDKGNVSQMTNAILELAGSAEKRNRYGEYARNYIRQKFSTQNFVTGFKAIIEVAE